MNDVLKQLLASKKALVLIATVIIAVGNRILARWGMELNADTVNLIVASGAAYMLGQGIADHGKGAEEVKVAGAAKAAEAASGAALLKGAA